MLTGYCVCGSRIFHSKCYTEISSKTEAKMIHWKSIFSAIRFEAQYQMAMYPTAGKLEPRDEWYYRVCMQNGDA